MKAYAVFDGGGVKGAALAGALAASQDMGIQFQGFAGTSAGAIVALLASIGYTGSEIRNLYLSELNPTEILGDKGLRLRTADEHCAGLEALVGTNRGKIFGSIFRIRAIISHCSGLLKLLDQEGGLYSSDRLNSVVRNLIVKKVPHLRTLDPITFQALEDAGGRHLKILAADLVGARAAVFSREDLTYGNSVVDAAVASASYPFLFRPLSFIGRYLSDGGLASNLPAFLFAQEYQRNRWPILAFDLVSEGEVKIDKSFFRICGRMMTTALEASDALIANVIPGVNLVRIVVPPSVHALKFDIDREGLEGLYAHGYQAASEFLNRFEPMAIARRAGADVKREVLAAYGPVRIYQPLLWAFIQMMAEKSLAQGLRASIMLPTSRSSRIVAYSFGFRETDCDTDLELAEFGGCSGRALKSGEIIVADLGKVKEAYSNWGLTIEQQNRIPVDRRSMVCHRIKMNSGSHDAAAAILAIDSSTELGSTGWIYGGASNSIEVRREILTVMEEWSEIFARVLFVKT